MREALSAENELCLCLARGAFPPEVRRRTLELLETPLRWDLLLQRARDHQVLPLLYRNLRILEFHGVPPRPRAELTAAFRVNALGNEFLCRELARILRLLGAAGLPVIPLKGVALAESLYGDRAYRVCSDLDILVPAGEALRARRLLLANGYTSPSTEEFFLKYLFHSTDECVLLPQSQVRSYPLEVHWTLTQHSSQDQAAMQDLWSLAPPHEFFGAQAHALTPEWLLLYLVSHAAHHRWDVLKWLVDIQQLCLAPNMNWELVREKSERFDLDLALGPSLTACATLFGTPIPSGLPSREIPPGVRLFPHSLDPDESWNSSLFYQHLLKRPSEKFRWFVETVFVARLSDRWFFRLPPFLSFLYFILRPLRLTCKWGWLSLRTALHRLRQRLSSLLIR